MSSVPVSAISVRRAEMVYSAWPLRICIWNVFPSAPAQTSVELLSYRPKAQEPNAELPLQSLGAVMFQLPLEGIADVRSTW